jgi:hypothetical protein
MQRRKSEPVALDCDGRVLILKGARFLQVSIDWFLNVACHFIDVLL